MLLNSIFPLIILVVITVLILLFVYKPDAQIVNNKSKNLQRNSITNGPNQSVVDSNLKLPEETILNSFHKYDEKECQPCITKVNGDTTDNSTIFTSHDKLEYIQPNARGEIEIPYGGWVKMRCSDNFVNPCGEQILEAQCVGGQNFLIEGEKRKFEDLNCKSDSRPTAMRTGLPCGAQGEYIQFGNKYNDGVLPTMRACFEKISQRTFYVEHTISPGTKQSKRGVKSKKFSQDDFFPDVNVDRCYQRNTEIKKLTKKDFLTRGHLVARADQIFSGQQKSTYHFLNAAPQWESFNSGNWSSIENGVREFANINDTILRCWTGTWGICTLSDLKLQQKLNDSSIPVPKLFYRIVIEDTSRKGIVLVGVNNPYLTTEEVNAGGYVLAEDISDRITWINWDRKNIEKGYCYACTVPNFTAIVNDLPYNDLHTTGILGLEELST